MSLQRVQGRFARHLCRAFHAPLASTPGAGRTSDIGETVSDLVAFGPLVPFNPRGPNLKQPLHLPPKPR
eukprot:997156-Pyramimonas_sp.AAC.1